MSIEESELLEKYKEIEIADDDSDEEPPQLRYSITSYGADYPVDSLVKRLKTDIIYVPEFQRKYVWSITQASKFIESLLLGLPVPGIFFSKDQTTNKFQIIDGQQRLKTLEYFYNKDFKGSLFKLKGVTSVFVGKTYDTLAPEDKQALDDAIIHATIIRQDEPKEDNSAIYYIFERLNTGGTLLRPQEIRACLYYGSLNTLLRDLSQNENWIELFSKPDYRLKSEETILRFFAFLYSLSLYEKPLKEFLNTFMRRNKNLNEEGIDTFRHIFEDTVNYVHESLGREAFRPKGQLVASVIDSIMVSAAEIVITGRKVSPQLFKQRYYNLIFSEPYVLSYTNATSDEAVVAIRFNLAKEALIDGR